MAYYLMQIAYTSEAWAALAQKPQNRNELVRPVIERTGGKLVNAWLSFGDYDVVAILDMPGNVDVAAISIAFAAGGSAKAVKTTPLMTWDEGMEAMRRAGGAGYRPPQG